MEANFYGEGNGVKDNETRTYQEGDLEAEAVMAPGPQGP